MAGAYAQFRTDITVRLDDGSRAAFAQFQNSAERAGSNASRSLDRVTRSAAGLEGKVRASAAAMATFSGYGSATASRLQGVANLFSLIGVKAGIAVGAIAGAAAGLSAASGVQNYIARLQAATNGQQDFINTFTRLSAVADSSRSSLSDTMAFYVRLKTATAELGISQQRLGVVMGTVQKAILLSGAGAQETTAALTQFVQGLSSANGLSGDEFKSLGENATTVLQAIAEGLKQTGAIKGFDGTIGALRELGAQGKLTADVLVPALERVSATVDSRFARMPVTITQSTTLLQNSLTRLIVNVEQSIGPLQATANAITFLADNTRLLGGVATVAGALLTARFVAPLLSAAPAAFATATAVARLALGFQGLGPALITGALGATKFQAAMTALLTPTNLLGAAITVTAGALYYFSTQASIAEKAAERLGISQDELRQKALGVTAAVNSTNAALREQGRLDAIKKRDDQADDALTARRRVVLALNNARENALARGDSGAAKAVADLTDRYKRLELSAQGVVEATKGLNLRPENYKGIVDAAANSTIAATAFRLLDDSVKGLAETTSKAGGPATAPAEKVTFSDIQAKAAAEAAASGTRAAAQARYRLVLKETQAALNAGSITESEAQQRIVAAIQTRDAEIASIKAATEAKRSAASQERADIRAATAAQEQRARSLELLADLQDRATESTRNARAEDQKRRVEALAALGVKAGGISPEEKAQALADIERERIKPLTDANREYERTLSLLELQIAGHDAEADALQRAYQLVDSIGGVAADYLDTTLAQVSAERSKTRELEQQRRAVEIYARSAADIQNSFRNLFAGGSVESFGTSLLDSFKQNFADQLSASLFGDAEQQARDKMTGALSDNVIATDTLTKTLLGLTSSPLAGGINGPANDNGSILTNSGPIPGLSLATAGLGAAGVGGALGALTRSANLVAQATTKPQAGGNALRTTTTQQFNELGQKFGARLDKAFGSGSTFAKAGAKLGTALEGATFGQAASGIGGALGLKQNKTAATIGGAIGGVIAGPIGGAIGGFLAGTIGGLFGKKAPAATATFTTGTGGVGTVGKATGDKSLTAAAGNAAAALSSSLASIAQSLGGTIAEGFAISLGTRKGKFVVDFTGTGKTKTGNAFDTQEEAIAFAVQNLVQRGIFKGLNAATNNLLTNGGDFETQLAKAVKFQGVFTDLKKLTDPVGAAVDEVNKRFEELAGIFKEAGASAEDYAKLQQLYDLQRAEALKAGEAAAVSTLKSFLTDLTTSEQSGLSLRDRRAAALATYTPLAAAVSAGQAVDQDKFVAAAKNVLDIERALFGSGNEYFDRLNQITTLTQQAIDRATVASSVADPLSFTGNTSNVVPITNGLSAIERQLNTTNDLLVAIANQNLNVSVGNSGGQAATVSVNRKGF